MAVACLNRLEPRSPIQKLAGFQEEIRFEVLRRLRRIPEISQRTLSMSFPPNTTIAVVGLGYVGLPLAVEFGKKYKTIGFDLSEAKIASYHKHCDPTGEVSTEDLQAAMRPGGLDVTVDPCRLASADFLIVAVPTPVDEAHIPDFSPLVGASTTVGRHMKAGATVIYESTVYPGATEEVCIPILERESGLKWKQDFHVGYSPERVNPGDKERTIAKIIKVVWARCIAWPTPAPFRWKSSRCNRAAIWAKTISCDLKTNMGDSSDPQSTYYWHHRPRRSLPCRTPPRQRL
jgi:hypothetical protein